MAPTWWQEVLSGAFECAMRDRSEDFCAASRKPSSNRSDAPKAAMLIHEPVHRDFANPWQSDSKQKTDFANPWQSDSKQKTDFANPWQSDSKQKTDFANPWQSDSKQKTDFANPRNSCQTEFSPRQSLSPWDPAKSCQPSPACVERLPRSEIERLHSILEDTGKIQSAFNLRSIHTREDTGYPDELPADFFQKMADLLARDRRVRQRVQNGDLRSSSGLSLRSRFLRECIKGREKAAIQIWRSLDVRDKQDFLMAYSYGPPTPDFLADALMSAGSSGVDGIGFSVFQGLVVSDCGSSSSDCEIRSDASFVS